MDDGNNNNSDPKSSLLGHRCNSVSSFRNRFTSSLPDKLRSGLDPEFPFDLDLSKASGLTQGEKEYYETQFATLKSFDEVDRIVQADSKEDEGEEDEEQRQAERAMKISNLANVILLAFKIFATVKSGSIAIAASTLDSLLDLMAGGILWFTHLSMKNVNIYKYPIGKLRVQPVGIIIFAAIMATLGFQVLIQAVEELIKGGASDDYTRDQLMWMCSIMIGATVVKLALFLYCRTSGNKIVRAYAQDHYFDVVTNVVGLAAALLGDAFYWWIDPVGAILLAVYTITNWSGTVMENAGEKKIHVLACITCDLNAEKVNFLVSLDKMGSLFLLVSHSSSFFFLPCEAKPCSLFSAVSLVGQSAPPEVLQKLTYLVLRHPKVKRIDTVRAYTIGVLYFVEVDIELPEDTPLKEAHAIGETLQDKLEKLPEVERAFVHLDYECDHKPEHTVLSRLPNSDA